MTQSKSRLTTFKLIAMMVMEHIIIMTTLHVVTKNRSQKLYVLDLKLIKMATKTPNLLYLAIVQVDWATGWSYWSSKKLDKNPMAVKAFEVNPKSHQASHIRSTL